jgi:hypothetical protein
VQLSASFTLQTFNSFTRQAQQLYLATAPMSAMHFTLQKAALLLLLVSAAVMISTAQAQPSMKGKKDFKACGGAKACLGAQKLDRIRRRSGLKHKTVDELAQELDQDEDLVSDRCRLLTNYLAGAASFMLCVTFVFDGTTRPALAKPQRCRPLAQHIFLSSRILA